MSGRTERVRLLGIDAPELNPRECFGREAAARTRGLALGKRVQLVGDATQDTRDRYSRLLAYVVVTARARDVGRQLIVDGYARAYVYRKAFVRVRSYRAAESAARRNRRGLWGNCGPTDPRPACAASYATVCIPPPPPDLDCADVPHQDFRVRHDVPEPDPHRFDGDADGVGCES